MAASLALSPTHQVVTSRAEWLAIRRRFIGASDIAALVGAHPYKTAYHLWLEKTGRLTHDESDDEAPQLERGRLLEPVAVNKLRQIRPDWTIEPNEIPGGCIIVDHESRMAATPDAFAIDSVEGRGVVQIKSIEPHAFRRQWKPQGEVALPLHVAIQANVEAALAGVSWAAAAALVVEQGITLDLLAVPLNPGLRARLAGDVRKFWDLVDNNIEPDMDYGRDADLIKQFAPPAVEGLTVRFDDDEEFCAAARAYREVCEQMNLDRKVHKRLNALLHHKMGEASLGLAEGLRVTVKARHMPAYSVPARTDRVLSVRGGGHHEDNE